MFFEENETVYTQTRTQGTAKNTQGKMNENDKYFILLAEPALPWENFPRQQI